MEEKGFLCQDAQSIAKVIGATTKHDGYLEGPAGPGDLRLGPTGAETRISGIPRYKETVSDFEGSYEERGCREANGRKAGYSKQFFEAHREEILLHKAAKEAFGQLESGVPKIKDLNRGD